MSTKGKTFPPEPLTSEEVGALLAACKTNEIGARNRALIMLLYRSGLRISEALALKPADLDFKRHTARVLHGKGNKATVRGFHPSADDALLRLLDQGEIYPYGTPRREQRGCPLFHTFEGHPLSDRYVRDMLKRAAAKAGITKRVHPHGLRHTYADELEQAGLPVSTISKLLGHSSVAVTSRYLGHLTNGAAIDALASLKLPDVEA